MNETLLKACRDFINYRDTIRQQFLWTGYSQTFPVCAYIHMNHHLEPNVEMIRLCKEILHENSGFFSAFRGSGEPIFVSMLAVEEDPGLKMEAVAQAYTVLRNYFMSSAYLPFLAMIMPDLMPSGRFVQFAESTRMLYEEMNREHYFLTGAEDVIFAGLLTMEERRNSAELMDEIEYLYDRLSGLSRFHGNAMQSLSHALTLCAGSAVNKFNNLQELCTMLRYQGINYGKDYEMIPLGILANLGIDIETLCRDLIDVHEYLGSQEGYGFFGFGARKRLVHACLILCAYYMTGTVELASAVIISVLLEIQAQQAAAAAAA